MRTSFHHQSEAQPPNGPLTAATSPDTHRARPSRCQWVLYWHVSGQVKSSEAIGSHGSQSELDGRQDCPGNRGDVAAEGG
jgi:hypothetical protein